MKKTILLSIALFWFPLTWGNAERERCFEGAEKRGYWWGCKLEEEEEEKLGPPPPVKELSKMLPQDIEKLLHDYRENAIRDLTEDSVLWYYQLQDFARRKSAEFASLTEIVMLKNPSLNLQAGYPVNPAGMADRYRQRSNEIRLRLAVERDRAALLLLTRKACKYCETQRKILKHFKNAHGWEISEIDLDERPSAIEMFNINFTPTTLIVIRDTNEWMPVAVGVESVPRIEESSYRALRLIFNETTPGQFTLQQSQHGTVFDPHTNAR